MFRARASLVGLSVLMVVWSLVALPGHVPGELARWDGWWQLIPSDLLRERAGESLWYLHAQPPLFNAIGAVLIKFSPGSLETGFHVLHIILGITIPLLVWQFVLDVTGSERFAWIAGGVVALDPALVIFGVLPGYDLATVFLATATATAAGRFQATRRDGWLVVLMGGASALVMLRSLFHPATLLLALVWVLWIARKRWLVFMLSLVLVLPPVGWCIKNDLLFGFAGTSSWTGMNLWKIASALYSVEDLRALAAANVIDADVAETWVFSPPSSHAVWQRTATSPIPMLARDNLHNAVVPAIARRYGDNAWRLIRHDPVKYLQTVVLGYATFSGPATDHFQVQSMAREFGGYVIFWERVLWGGAVSDVLPARGRIHTGSLLFFIWPVLLVGLLWCSARRGLMEGMRRDFGLWSALALMAYVTVIGSAAELGENDRFRLVIEPLMIAMAVIGVYRFTRPPAPTHRR